jgi:hypothetical protein
LPKKTLKKIKDKGAFYLVCVKGNQPNLLKSIKRATQSSKNKIARYETKEKKHGRLEHRIYELYQNQNKRIQMQWSDFINIIKVRRIRQIKGVRNVEVVYYINNNPNADIEELATGIRNHWLIENSLHWVKDVTFGEDKRRLKEKKSNVIFSIFLNIAINILRKNEKKYLKRTMRLYCNNIEALCKILE